MSYTKPKSISQINLSNNIPTPVIGAALTPIVYQDDTGIVPDSEYFTVPLPGSDITINVKARVEIQCDVSILRTSPGPGAYVLQLFRDTGAGFNLVPWVNQYTTILDAFAIDHHAFKTVLDVDVGDVFRSTEIRAGGGGDASVLPRQAIFNFNILEFLD